MSIEAAAYVPHGELVYMFVTPEMAQLSFISPEYDTPASNSTPVVQFSKMLLLIFADVNVVLAVFQMPLARCVVELVERNVLPSIRIFAWVAGELVKTMPAGTPCPVSSKTLLTISYPSVLEEFTNTKASVAPYGCRPENVLFTIFTSRIHRVRTR